MGLDLLALPHGIRQRQRRRVQHLARHGHQTGVAGRLQTKGPVTDNGVTDARKMTADLIRAPRLDADAQEGGVGAGGLACDDRDRRLVVKRCVDLLVRLREAAGDNRGVGLRDTPRLEDLNCGDICGIGLCEEQAPRRVTVKTMHGLEVRLLDLDTQNGLDGLGVLVRENARGLVRNNVVGRLDEHTHVLAHLGGYGGLRAAGLAACRGDDGLGNLDGVARLERMVRCRDAGVV